MIAYLFWHCAYPTTTVEQYEEALMRFQQRLGQQQPPGFGGSASFRVAALPWLGNRPGYEDWCLLDGSWALDPLNAFAVAGPVMSAHDAAAAQMEEGHGGLYALVWGEPILPERSTAVWLTRPRGIQWRTTLDALQLPGTTLWRRQMVLGPGKEFALIVPPGLNVAAPAGWSALAIERVRVDAPVTNRPKREGDVYEETYRASVWNRGLPRVCSHDCLCNRICQRNRGAEDNRLWACRRPDAVDHN